MTITNTQFWRRGFYLSKAYYKFAIPEARKRYDDAMKISAWDAFEEATKRESTGDKAALDVFANSLQAATPILANRNQLRKDMQDFVRDHLIKGNLIAFGFEPPRKISDQPIRIPAYCWKGRIDWDDSALVAQGLRFEQIRIIVALWQEKIIQLDAPEAEAEDVKSPGRPSWEKHILSAFDALKEAGEINTDEYLTSHYGKVRAWLEINVKASERPPKLPHDNTLNKYLSPLFNALKEDQKL